MKILRPIGELHGQLPENGFVAYTDDAHLDVPVGAASVRPFFTEQLFPDRPLNLLIRLEGNTESYDALMGAAFARCRMIQSEYPNLASRVYAECDPENLSLIRYMASWGLMKDDSVLRLYTDLDDGPARFAKPAGCELQMDRLQDPLQAQQFLDYYNRLFSRRYGQEWLDRLRTLPNFARFRLLSPEGVAGELLTYSYTRYAIIYTLFTVPRWQKRHVASFMLDSARTYWRNLELIGAYADVWERLKPAMALFQRAGYRIDYPVIAYPGANEPPFSNRIQS